MSSYSNAIRSLLKFLAAPVSLKSSIILSASIVGPGCGVLFMRLRGSTSRMLCLLSIVFRCNLLLSVAGQTWRLILSHWVLLGSVIDKDLGFLSWGWTLVLPDSMAAKLSNFYAFLFPEISLTNFGNLQYRLSHSWLEISENRPFFLQVALVVNWKSELTSWLARYCCVRAIYANDTYGSQE